MFMTISNWLFMKWLEETHSETSVQAIGSHRHTCHGEATVQLNSIWLCKLTSKQIWGKLSEQTDWFKAKDSPKAEIRGTFRDPSATPNNILFSVVEVKSNATARHIIIAKPISQWQDTGMMVSLCSYGHTSSYSAVYCSIQPAYWTYLCVLPRGQWIRTLTHGCVAAPYALCSMQMLYLLEVISLDCQQWRNGSLTDKSTLPQFD